MMADVTAQEAQRRVTFYLPDEVQSSGPVLGGTSVILLMSLVTIPLTFFLNSQQWMHNSQMILLVGAMVLCLVVLIPYMSLRRMNDCDQVLYGNTFQQLFEQHNIPVVGYLIMLTNTCKL